jgi:hypothetical protein
MWKNYDTEFQGILQSLRRHKDLVEHRASVTQYRRYQGDMIELKARLYSQVEEEKLKKLVIIREWLAVGQQPSDDHAIYQEIRKKYATTAKWILERDTVKEWIRNDIPATPCMQQSCFQDCPTLLMMLTVLWMHGIPGAGMDPFHVLLLLRLTSCRKNCPRICYDRRV